MHSGVYSKTRTPVNFTFTSRPVCSLCNTAMASLMFYETRRTTHFYWQIWNKCGFNCCKQYLCCHFICLFKCIIFCNLFYTHFFVWVEIIWQVQFLFCLAWGHLKKWQPQGLLHITVTLHCCSSTSRPLRIIACFFFWFSFPHYDVQPARYACFMFVFSRAFICTIIYRFWFVLLIHTHLFLYVAICVL